MPRLVINKQYSDPVAPTSSQLDAAFDSISTFFNVTGVGADNIEDDTIGGSKLIDNAVTETKFAAAAVGNSEIADGSITAAKLAAAVRTRLSPPGMIRMFAGDVPPQGYLLCDGAPVSRTTYQALFTAVGVNFGAGDSITTFNVPDLRGRLLRGVDKTAGRDPDSANRTAMNTGGNIGNNVGSVQDDAFQDHRHDSLISGIDTRALNSFDPATLRFTASVTQQTSYASVRNGADGTRTSSETRPKNAYVQYIIKT